MIFLTTAPLLFPVSVSGTAWALLYPLSPTYNQIFLVLIISGFEISLHLFPSVSCQLSLLWAQALILLFWMHPLCLNYKKYHLKAHISRPLHWLLPLSIFPNWPLEDSVLSHFSRDTFLDCFYEPLLLNYVALCSHDSTRASLSCHSLGYPIMGLLVWLLPWTETSQRTGTTSSFVFQVCSTSLGGDQ